MQDLLTLTLESLAIAVTLIMFLDFFCGLRHLYNASATTTLGKPEEAMLPRGSAAVVIAFVPTPIDADETAPLNDPWITEVEEVIESFYCYAITPKPVYLLPPATLSVVDSPVPADYDGWTIRALKKEAQNRKLSKYSSLAKNQLISRLTAA